MKAQAQIAASLENLASKFDELTKHFEGFQTMMKQTLDTLSGMGAWQTSANEPLGDLQQWADAMKTSIDAVSTRINMVASRLDNLEVRSQAALGVPDYVRATPAPLSSLLCPSPQWLDLNLAPGTSSRSPALDGERPKGHGTLCGRILGPRS